MAANPNRMQQRKERRMFATSDDTAMTKQVLATHAPDGRDIVVNPIIQLVDEILIHAIAPDVDLSCKCSGSVDEHATTMVILNTLSRYKWHAKMVFTLAAFAVKFGEFWLVAQQSSGTANINKLAKSVALLKQLPDLVESSAFLKPQLDALNLLVKAALDVTKSIVEFKSLPSQYISEDTPPMSVASAHIPIAAYWTIRSVVALSSQITSLIGLRNEYVLSTPEEWELSSLAYKVSSVHKHLKTQLAICYKYMDDKKYVEDYEFLKECFQIAYVDNQKILSILFRTTTDPLPLVDASRTKVGVELLRKKHVLLLISDLDISQEEIVILDNLYQDAKMRTDVQYEMVWIPIVNRSNWNDINQEKFGSLQSMMPWYSVHHPLDIDHSVIKYIREDWNFSKRTIIVALDPQARVCSTNALHMLWIWGNWAFPFTSDKEESLWKAEIWSLELIVDGIDANLLEWMTEGRHICLYGGEDINWLRTFTSTAMSVARLANITLELVYVGKSNAKERMQRMISTFAQEKLSHFWPNVTSIWFFWARLESMLYSKLQLNKTVENDEIMSEVMTVLTFDGSDKGWAIFCKGADMAKANGTTALKGLNEFENWKINAEIDGFVPAFREYLEPIHPPRHCNRLILPGSTGGIPERVVCAECGRQMEKYFMYRCCVE
ncbi:hypothetical protein L6164_014795 [Bauhinia variegata]|uniref:Uncharacterized protein n=1 Tax=Bauhinia variegata TaxID=167791 RepID=A0ACB9NJ80_BAUVA|nr:hypothetical protein L6164_014795 [Bauhinia variegata]